MKRILITLTSVFLLIGAVIGLAACSGGCEHSFSEEYVVKEATCTEGPIIGLRCSKCGEEDSSNGPFHMEGALGHDYGAFAIAEYPVFGKGKIQATCSRCPSLKEEEIPAISGGAYTTETVDENTVKYKYTFDANTNIVFDCPTDITYEPVRENNEIIGVCAVRCKDDIKDAVIPAKYMDYNVLSVGRTANSSVSGFAHCDSVVLSEGIESISDNTFNTCWNLKEITLPTTLKVVGEYAFYDCRNLVKTNVSDFGAYCSIQFETENTSYYAAYFSSTPAYVYVNGTAVKDDIVIPDGVTEIGACTFRGYESVTSLTIPGSVKSIGNSAFEDCALTEVTIPASVEIIDSYAFNGCRSLTSLTLNNGLKDIGSRAFGASPIASINLPESLTAIGSYAFSGAKITSIVIPGGVKTVTEGSFYNCVDLESVTLQNGVEAVEKNAFDKCASIKLFKVGNTLKTVHNEAFGFIPSCTLNEFYISDLSSWCRVDIIDSIPVSKSTSIYVGDQPLTNVELPEDITEIKDYTFFGWGNLDTLVIPSNVTSIGKYAFLGSSLREVVLPAGITEIKEGTFNSCTSLEKIVIPSNVESIGYDAFRGCTSLTEIVIPKKVTKLANRAFYDCYNVVNVFYEGSEEDWGNVDKVSADISTDKLCYYSATLPKDVLNKYWKYNTQDEPALWTYENTLDGRTYSYSNTDTTVSEEYFSMLKLMEQNNMLENYFGSYPEQVEMVKSSTTKEEYAEKLEAFSASIFTDLTISFANGKVTIAEAGADAIILDFIEYDGVVYYVIGGEIQQDVPAYYIDEQSNTIYEYTENETEVGNTTILATTVKHIHTLIVE